MSSVCQMSTASSNSAGARTALGANEGERLSPSGPMVREPHPEETIEAPELGSLRSAAEQGKLLPERQVLEREVGAGS